MPSPSFSPDSFQTFGDLLKYLRRRARLTQLELSIAVGYSEAQIGRLEKNQRLPDLTAIRALFIPALHLESEPELTSRFLELAESARQEDAPAPGLAPYKGLLFFDESDSELFFGREILTGHLTEHVMDLSMDSSSRLLAVVGASGSGKSSLVRAGLAVALKRVGWDTRVFTPTANPLRMLEANLNLAQRNGAERVLLLVDQFEEVFTLCRDEIERISFIEKLLNSAQDKSKKATVVIALRADFYSHCAQYPLLRKALAAEQEYIGQMTVEELRRAIEEPARHGGWEFEPGLVDILLQDIGAQGTSEPEPGALPLLSHALLATWERRRGRTFTLDGYHASGGVRGAIAETAESVFTDQLNQAQQELARDVFLRLTELGDGTEDTRRRAALNELVRQSAEAPQLRAVLNTLAEARLITLNEDSAEVAHEALIREWQRLHEWLTQDRDGLLLHRHLTESAHDWEARQHDSSELYRGARLAQAREWASANEERLNAPERAFLSASIEHEECDALEREAQRQRELEAAQKLAETQSRAAKQLRRRAIILTGAFALAIILAGFALFFGNQANWQRALAVDAQAQAEQQARESFSRELAAAAIASLEGDPNRSILLALQAVTKADTIQAQDALHQAVQNSRLLQASYGTPEEAEGASFASFSPDGTRLITSNFGTNGHLTRVRDAATLKVLFVVPGIFADDQWTDVNHWPTLSPGDTPNSTVITFWNAGGNKISSLTIPTGIWSYTAEGLTGRDFSPDFRQVALAEEDGTISIFETTTGQKIHTLGETGRPFSHFILFSPNGRLLLTGGYETHEVTLWDIASGRELLTRQMQGGTVALAFSPDEMHFAISDGKTATLIDRASGTDLLTLPSSTGFRDYGLLFNPDGSGLVTVEEGGIVHIWDAITGHVTLTLTGAVSDGPVAFNPDSTRLVTASVFGIIQLWGLLPEDSREWLTVPDARAVNTTLLINNRYSCTCGVAFSPSGAHLAVSKKDNTVKILDTNSGKTVITLKGDEDGTWSPSFSPDGTRIATANADNSVKIWNATTGKELLTLFGHTDWVNRIAFSPDGARLATISYDHTARLWDATSGKLLFSQEVYSESDSPTIGIDIAFSPDGTRFATAGNRIVKVWETATGKEILDLSTEFLGETNQPDSATAVTFSPDGRQLAVAYLAGRIGVYDQITGQKLFDLSTGGSVTRVAYSLDGSQIAASLGGGRTRIWDAKTGSAELTLSGHSGQVVDLAFSPDGTRLATVGTDETVRVYALRLEDLVKIAQSHVTRSLTTRECQQYLHVEECPVEP